MTAVLDDERLRRVLRPDPRARARRSDGRRLDALDRRRAPWTGPWRSRDPTRTAPPLHRQGARPLRGRPRPDADRRLRPDLGVRRRAARRDPRQGAGAHRAVDVLVRADRGDLAEPPGVLRPDRLPRDGRSRGRRPGDARAGDPADPARVHRPRLPVRVGVVGVRGAGHRLRPDAARPGCARPSGSRSRSSPRPPRPRPATTSRSPTPRRPRSWAPTSSSRSATPRSRSTDSPPTHAAACGLLLADTKLEFGTVDDELLVIDEMLTPDSSRYWPAEDYRVGTSPPSFDKQYVRDHYLALGWDQEPPAPGIAARGRERDAGPLRRGLRAAHRTQLRRVVRHRVTKRPPRLLGFCCGVADNPAIAEG